MRLSVFFVALAIAPSAWAVDPSTLAAHRAQYDLQMDRSRRPSSDVGEASGTLSYEITDACDAWASQQRLTINTVNRDGQTIELVSDYVTLESKDGLSMQFRMKQTTETAVMEEVEGHATLERTGGPGTVVYEGKTPHTVALPAGTLFPMMHTAAIIQAAEDGKKYLSVPTFDGTGDKGAQDSGIAIANWGKSPPGPFEALNVLPSGRVRIAYFDRERDDTPEKVPGAPDYEVGMRYYQNGVSDDLVMEFSEFVLKGRLTQYATVAPHC